MPISTKNAKYTKRSIFCLLVFTLYSYLCKVFTTKIVIFQRFFWKKSCKLPVDLLYWAALYSKSITVKVSNKAVKVGKLSKINKRKVTLIREHRALAFVRNHDVKMEARLCGTFSIEYLATLIIVFKTLLNTQMVVALESSDNNRV